MKILIAEDERSFSMVMEKLMTKQGYGFDLVNNGQDAVNRAIENAGKYDLCFMDIDMPVMDGCEATKLIRLKTKYLSIIAVTEDLSFKDKYSEFEVDAYIKKPSVYYNREIAHLMPQEFLTEEEYDESIKTEDQDLQKYSKLVLKEDEE